MTPTTKGKPPKLGAGYLRGLLMLQSGRCALTGVPMAPQDARADHIIPLGRPDLEPTPGMGNLWIVSRRANAAKGQMTYEEFVELCRRVVEYHDQSERLMTLLSDPSNVPVVKKADFETWVEKHLAPDGTLSV